MYDIVLKLIMMVHTYIVVFVTLVPLCDRNLLLFYHSVFVPFMIMHWILNDNTCVFTIAERYITKELYGDYNEDECVTCKLVEPVYDFKNNYEQFENFIYGFTISLWLVSITKLYCKYEAGEIRHWKYLFLL